jgi:hypothetical protein
MKHRRVFAVDDLGAAAAAIALARENGVGEHDVSLVAREDIELEALPTDLLDPGTDTVPAAIRGAVGGGGLGLLAGLIAAAVPAFGVTIAGAGLLAAIGTMVGTWSSALIGSAVPNEVRRRFEEEIRRGRILVVVDADEDTLAKAAKALREVGAEPLPFDSLSMTS